MSTTNNDNIETITPSELEGLDRINEDETGFLVYNQMVMVHLHL